jgi:hypothetical protein
MKKLLTLITAIAIGLLAGSAVGVAAQGEAAPETEPVPATWVTGTIIPSPTCTDASFEVDGAVRRGRGASCTPQTWETSDPRLDGETAALWNVDIYDVGDAGATSVATFGYDVRNEAGGWECRSNILAHGRGQFPAGLTGETAMCVGDGGYDGLSSILVIDGPDGFNSIVGLIFPGDAPPPPELPAAE